MTAESMFRQCLKKRKYSWERAEQVKARRFREAGVRLRTYFCPLCSHYHLTHLPYDGNVRNVPQDSSNERVSNLRHAP